jgi:hypothetical protein
MATRSREDRTWDAVHAAVHNALAERLGTNPGIVTEGLAVLEQWRASRIVPDRLISTWHEWLRLPAEELAARLRSTDPECTEVRRVSPIAHLLPPAMHWRIRRLLKEQLKSR